MKLKYIFIILISLFFSTSCNKEENNIEKIAQYLKDDLGKDLNKNDLYLFLPIKNTCYICIQDTQDFLELVATSGEYKDIHIVYIGTSKKEMNLISKDLQDKFDVIFDYKNIGIKKKIFSTNFILVNMNSSFNQMLEFSKDNNFEVMKAEVANFLNKKN